MAIFNGYVKLPEGSISWAGYPIHDAMKKLKTVEKWSSLISLEFGGSPWHGDTRPLVLLRDCCDGWQVQSLELEASQS